MIKSFEDKRTKRLFERFRVKDISLPLQRLALRKLTLLDAAEFIADLRCPPGNCLEKLSGRRKEQYSIRVNQQWRICFQWKTGHAYHVEFVDYH